MSPLMKKDCIVDDEESGSPPREPECLITPLPDCSPKKNSNEAPESCTTTTALKQQLSDLEASREQLARMFEQKKIKLVLDLTSMVCEQIRVRLNMQEVEKRRESNDGEDMSNMREEMNHLRREINSLRREMSYMREEGDGLKRDVASLLESRKSYRECFQH